jgi:HlyD family secretion protein
MKRTLTIVAVVAVVAAVAFGIYTYMTGTSSASGSGLGGTGTIEAVNVTVSSQASGRIVAARVKVGDVVKKGQVLFMLDRQMSLQQIAQAEAGVKAAEATLQYAKDNSKTDAEIAQDSAAVDQAKATLKMAQIQYGYTTVTAPISGVALTVPVNTGENATPGQTLAKLGDTEHLTVSIYVPENQIGQVKVGKVGSLTTDSSTSTYKCVVTSVASQAEFTPASIETKDQRVKLVYQVQLDVADKTGTLKPGMPADVKL